MLTDMYFPQDYVEFAKDKKIFSGISFPIQFPSHKAFYNILIFLSSPRRLEPQAERHIK